MRKVIDDDSVLYHYYDSREEFVVDFDEELVELSIDQGTVRFLLKDRKVGK